MGARVPAPRGLLHLLVWGAVWGCVVGAAPRHSWLGRWGVCVFVRAPCLFPAFPGSGVLCGRACWALVFALPRPSWLGCWGVFFSGEGRVMFWLCGVGRWLSRSRVLWSLSPHPLSFWLGCWLSFFFPSRRGVCPRVLAVPFPGGPLAWCCRFWLGGPPVPLWGVVSSVPSGWGFWPPLAVLVGGLVAVGHCLAPPPPPVCFFGGGGLPVPPSPFSGLAHALVRIQCGLPGCCWWLRSAWMCPGPMGRAGYVHVGLGAPSCRVRFWLCRLGGCAKRLRVAVG